MPVCVIGTQSSRGSVAAVEKLWITSEPGGPAGALTAAGLILYLWPVFLASLEMILLAPILAEPRHFSLVEKLLFAGLAIASGYGFWRRFGKILNKILQSKRDPSFRLFPIGNGFGISSGKFSARPK